jgi:hypothetical protein
VEFVASSELREEVCGDTDMTTLSRQRGGVEEGVCEGEFGWVCKRGGGDGAVLLVFVDGEEEREHTIVGLS